jgi:hypothetical protein
VVSVTDSYSRILCFLDRVLNLMGNEKVLCYSNLNGKIFRPSFMKFCVLITKIVRDRHMYGHDIYINKNVNVTLFVIGEFVYNRLSPKLLH